jgi:hypothetical protein
MDDKTRRVGGEREDMAGRAEETTRNLATTPEGTTTTPSSSAARVTGSTRRNTSGSRKTTSTASNAEGLDRETDERTRELQAEIADTREEMSETIEAIQERLRPGTIMSNATDTVKEKARDSVRGLTDNAGERASGMMREAKHNAVPALMIGAGVAWMLIDRSRHRSDRRWDTRQRGWSAGATSGRRAYGEYGTGYGRNYVEAGTGLDLDDDAEYSDIDYRRDYDSQRRGLTSNVAGRASNVMDGARDRWQRTTRNTTSGLQRLMRDNPLLVGAAAVLVGAAVGASLPETERENEMMGETRDTMVNQAQEMAQNAASTVKDVASNIPGQVTEAVTSKVMEGSGTKPDTRSNRKNQPVGTAGNTGNDTWRRE